MRNLKSLVLTLALVMALGIGSANAFCFGCGDETAILSGGGEATDYDKDYSSTKWRGNWNDKAKGEASSFAGFTLDLEATGYGFAHVSGGGDADANAKAWSWAKDYGTTSKAGAGAKTSGDAFAAGLAIGFDFCKNTVDTTVYVGGSVHQYNEAGETGYSAGGISGGNNSGGSFFAQDRDLVKGYGIVADTNSIDGGMITKGKTEVSIDPYGYHRSISGSTENMTKICADHIVQANVYGSGGVGGSISKGGNVAGGVAEFSYSGATYGSGSANINANVTPGHVSFSGSATATAIGSGTQVD